MHRAQRIERSKPKTAPQIIDTRQPKVIPQSVPIDPEVANLPLRTVLLLEVGDMEPAKIQLLVQEANRMYDGARGGIHYVLPIRHGKIGTDVVFEKEWERIVQETCEIRDGQIKLSGVAVDCHIIRQKL